MFFIFSFCLGMHSYFLWPIFFVLCIFLHRYMFYIFVTPLTQKPLVFILVSRNHVLPLHPVMCNPWPLSPLNIDKSFSEGQQKPSASTWSHSGGYLEELCCFLLLVCPNPLLGLLKLNYSHWRKEKLRHPQNYQLSFQQNKQSLCTAYNRILHIAQSSHCILTCFKEQSTN